MSHKKVSYEQQNELLDQLKIRFQKNSSRHKGLEWASIEAKLLVNPEKVWTLSEMERTGGEPDVVGFDKKAGEHLFYDCSVESPSGRRSLCYDRVAWKKRKEFKPKDTAMDMATAIGVEILTEVEYRYLQTLGEFDTKSSSWLQTPADIRTRGGAIFGDRRYDTVFVYHNGADSYYASRGFRGKVRI